MELWQKGASRGIAGALEACLPEAEETDLTQMCFRRPRGRGTRSSVPSQAFLGIAAITVALNSHLSPWPATGSCPRVGLFGLRPRGRSQQVRWPPGPWAPQAP